MRSICSLPVVGMIIISSGADANEIELGKVTNGYCEHRTTFSKRALTETYNSSNTEVSSRTLTIVAVPLGDRLPPLEQLAHCVKESASEMGLGLISDEPRSAALSLRERSNSCLRRLDRQYWIDGLFIRRLSSCDANRG